jgi:hypothetical protein
MRVMICLEFDGVDCNSEKADAIVEAITESCETMQVGFNASSCWVDNAFNLEEEVK